MADNPDRDPNENENETDLSSLQTLIEAKNIAAAELGLRIQEQYQPLMDSIVPMEQYQTLLDSIGLAVKQLSDSAIDAAVSVGQIDELNDRQSIVPSEQFQSLMESMLPAQNLTEHLKHIAPEMAFSTLIDRIRGTPLFDTMAYEMSEIHLPDITPIWDNEDKYQDQERLARLIAEEIFKRLEKRNQANFPEEGRGRTPDFMYEWAYEQYKRGRERRHVWINFVEFFLDEPTLSADDLREIKKAFDKAIDRRRKRDKPD